MMSVVSSCIRLRELLQQVDAEVDAEELRMTITKNSSQQPEIEVDAEELRRYGAG